MGRTDERPGFFSAEKKPERTSNAINGRNRSADSMRSMKPKEMISVPAKSHASERFCLIDVNRIKRPANTIAAVWIV